MKPDRSWPEPGETHGIEKFAAFVRQFLDAFGSVRFDHEREPRVMGEWAVLRGSWVGTGATTGIEGRSVAFTVLFRSRAGLVTDALFFADEDEALDLIAQQTATAS
jgi:hypothetical protein